MTLKEYNPQTKTMPELELDLVKFCSESERAGLAWAKADSEKSQLEDFKKIVLNQNMPSGGAYNERERAAMVSEAYRDHILALSAAVYKANEAKVRYSAALAKMEALRTILSNRRELVKRGIE